MFTAEGESWADGQWSSRGCAQSSHHCLFQPTVIVPHAHREAYCHDRELIVILADETVQQPSRGHQEIIATIQSPSGTISNHPEATRKQRQPSTMKQQQGTLPNSSFVSRDRFQIPPPPNFSPPKKSPPQIIPPVVCVCQHALTRVCDIFFCVHHVSFYLIACKEVH